MLVSIFRVFHLVKKKKLKKGIFLKFRFKFYSKLGQKLTFRLNLTLKLKNLSNMYMIPIIFVSKDFFEPVMNVSESY